MKLRYYEDTDTLVIVFSDGPSTESEIAKNVVVDLDPADQVVAMEIEHASTFVGEQETKSGKLNLESIRRTGLHARNATGARRTIDPAQNPQSHRKEGTGRSEELAAKKPSSAKNGRLHL